MKLRFDLLGCDVVVTAIVIYSILLFFAWAMVHGASMQLRQDPGYVAFELEEQAKAISEMVNRSKS